MKTKKPDRWHGRAADTSQQKGQGENNTNE